MQIAFVEIQNFRKLKSIRVDFARDKTIFVGANNSGKTSAIVALRHFLSDKNRFCAHDFTLSNWTAIAKIGSTWESASGDFTPKPQEWDGLLPVLDVWLNAASNEIQYVRHILPTLDWDGGLLGVRLRFEPENVVELFKEYSKVFKAAKETVDAAAKANAAKNFEVALWPSSLRDFLDRRLQKTFTLRAYILDPKKLADPVNGAAKPQELSNDSEAIQGNPFNGLIRIDEIDAQRGFNDATDGNENASSANTRILSEQLRAYYTTHIDPIEIPEPEDVDALNAIFEAQRKFEEKLRLGLKNPFETVRNLGYPGINDPKLTLSTRVEPLDGLRHPAALQYEIESPSESGESAVQCLPERYNGLGYQNLISMVFRLMSFRDAWMQYGKLAKKLEASSGSVTTIPPLHLVLIEEPEAHLHVQVQQVFIRKAYEILRKHADLGEKSNLRTQLIVSTHSSHIAHECEFSCLRYFRRKPAMNPGEVPTSSVVNLSTVFGSEDETKRFVTRYLRATHCELFFADAAILVEGPAERILVPHFIREHFPKLNQSFLTLLEIGGSHAHRLKPLVETLGLTTLIITDLDAASGTGHHKSEPPKRGVGQVCRNATLKTWIPKEESIDSLLDKHSDGKVVSYDQTFSVRVAYQSPVRIQIDDTKPEEEALANTFEDALVFSNLGLFRSLEGEGMIEKMREVIAAKHDANGLADELFKIIDPKQKAKFALDLLLLNEELQNLTIPFYIQEGLEWLQERLESRYKDIQTAKPIAPVIAGNGSEASLEKK